MGWKTGVNPALGRYGLLQKTKVLMIPVASYVQNSIVRHL